MKLQQFVDQVIREICAGAKDSGKHPPQLVEMDIAVTSTGEVCSLQSESAGRVKITLDAQLGIPAQKY